MSRIYYVKFNIDTNGIILDVEKESEDASEILIDDYRLDQHQGELLKKSLEKYKNPLYPDVLLECKRLFYTCDICGFVSTKKESNKAWKGLCETCFREGEIERKKIYDYNRYQDKKLQTKLNRFKRFIATTQGRINAVPMEVIQSNVRYWMFVRGRLYKDLADVLSMTPSRLSELFNRVYMSEEIMVKIADFIGVEIDKLLEIPKGYKLDLHHGFPASWFSSNLPYLKKEECQLPCTESAGLVGNS